MKCSNCRTLNSDNSKFCLECGHKLEGIDKRQQGISFREGERKYVTVLFTDMTGYTALMEKHDPEEMKEIMLQVFGEISRIIIKYEGFIEKYIGDAAMALFGVQKTLEDDAVRAIKAAGEIHDVISKMNTALEMKTGIPVFMHSGINTGLVFTSEINEEKGIHGALGSTINVAARLLQLAGTDEIVVGYETFQQTEGYFSFEPLPHAQVKGIDAQIKPFRVLSSIEKPKKLHRLSGIRAEFIGRRNEMSLLHEALAEIKEGKGKIISIVGDAGTGKSRLIEEFKAGLNPAEIQWREGHAYPYSKNTPYFPMIDLYRRTLEIKASDSPEQVRHRLEARLRYILAEREDLVSYIGSLFSISYPEIAEVSPEYKKARLREAIQLTLTNLSKTVSTVICIEDLHWADSSTVELMTNIFTGYHYPILFLCTYRPSFTLFSSGKIGDIDCHREIILKDLSPTESREMFESLLKTKNIPEELSQFINDNIEGNPFYIEESINSLIETGTLINKGGQWLLSKPLEKSCIPSTVQGIIMARLDNLDIRTKRILQEASVIGRVFIYEILKRITEIKDNIHESIAVLERLDLIRRDRNVSELKYIFKHALIQEVVYSTLLRKERQTIHEIAGHVIEEMFKDCLPDFYETLAFHFKSGFSIDKAIYYSRKAGQKNLDRYALDEAYQYYKDAFDLLADQPDKTREQEQLLIDILLDWVVVYYHRAAYQEMYKLLSQYEALVKSLSDEARLGMFYVRIGSALSRMEMGRDAYRYLHDALALGESIGNQQIIGYACTWLIINCADLGLLDEAIEIGERVQGMDVYRTDKYVFRLSTASIGYAHYFRGEAGKVQSAGDKLLEYGGKHDDMGSIVLGHTCHGIGYVVMGDFPAAIDCFKTSIQASLEPIYAYTTKIMLGITYVANGQYQEADNVLREITVFNERHGYGFVGTIAQGLSGIVMITKGELQKGVDAVTDVINSCIRNESMFRYASLNLLLGKVYLQIAQGGGGGKRDLSFLIRNILFLIKTVPVAHKKSEEHLMRAIETSKEIGTKNLLAQSFLEMGRLRQLKGQTEEAGKYFTDAMELFQKTGASVFLSQAMDALAALK